MDLPINEPEPDAGRGAGPRLSQAAEPARVAVIVVGFRNARDVAGCLRALSEALPEPSFDVYIAENGGPSAMGVLLAALDADGSRCERAPSPDEREWPAAPPAHRTFRLVRPDGAAGPRVHVAEMPGNLGYAGAVNAWLRPLLRVPGWEAAWILNPDTEVTPSALAELAAHSARWGKGMVGSSLITSLGSDRVHSRGLAWRKLAARTLAIDYQSRVGAEADPEEVDRRLDSPSGASCYVTRTLIERIGLMDESYFLYFEDLEWGCRAKAEGGVGYAQRSMVVHEGGTTIGTAQTRAAMSPLSVYLEFRNRIIFVRRHHRGWLAWTVLMQCVYAAALCVSGAAANMPVALRGVLAGVRGETGRPERMLHAGRPRGAGRAGFKRSTKIALSCGYAAARAVAGVFKRPAPDRLVVLYYHAVPEAKRDGFARQMRALARRARVVPADWDGTPGDRRPAVAITFDDAFASVAENALPVLAELGLPCTIFAPSGVLGRRPDWSMESGADAAEIVVDAERLARMRGPLVAIGAHSVTHPRLSRLAPGQARAEIAGSRDALAAALGCPVTLFAFPYGDHDAGVAEICRQEGFRHAFTIAPRPVEARDGALLRGRVAVEPDDGDIEFGLKMSGAYAWMPLVSALKRRALRGRAG